MNKLKLLGFSGAATKIAAHAAHGKNILRYYSPDVITGVSSGALVILPLILGKHRELKDITTNLKLTDMFKSPPVNESGKITLRGYARGLTKGAFGEMSLEKLIGKLVTRKEYESLMAKETTPIIYIGITNMTLSKFELVKLNELDYDRAVQTIITSATIPIYCNPVQMGKYFYADGGLKVHNPTSEVIRLYANEFNKVFTEVISVYSRPKSYLPRDYPYNGKYLGRNLSKTLDILQLSISLENERTEKELAGLYGIKLKQFFSPNITKGVYDVNKERLLELYNLVDRTHGMQ